MERGTPNAEVTRSGSTDPGVAAKTGASDALYRQLAMIAGDEPATSYIEIRPFRTRGGLAAEERAFIPVQRLDDVVERVRALAPDLNVYIGAAPRIRQEGTITAVERVWCLWADCDTTESAAAVHSFVPAPTLRIRSGSGDNVHAWWALHEPFRPEWARRANRRLALALGADMNATDAARIMRPAGSLNHKHQPPTAVTCTRAERDTFTLSDVVGGLPDARDYLAAEPGRAAQASGPRPFAGLIRLVRQAREGNRNGALFWAACRACEMVVAGSLDSNTVREELLSAALAAGLGEPEAEATLRSAFNAAGPA